MINFDSEKDLENLIFENAEHFASGLGIEYDGVLRQPHFGCYGIGDIVYFRWDCINNDPILTINLLELKNKQIEHKHVSQCARYKTYFDRLGERLGFRVFFEASLIGLETFPNNNDLVFLCQEVDWLNVYELNINPTKGVSLKHINGWYKTDEDSYIFNSFITFVKPNDEDYVND